jgi:hypothetical protein
MDPLTEIASIKLIEKIWCSAHQFFGGVLQPHQMRREANAEADAKRLLAQAAKDCQDIQHGRKCLSEGNKLTALESGYGAYENVHQLRAANNIREAVNLDRAVMGAEQVILESDHIQYSGEPVKESWLVAWRDAAKNVSDQALQSLWSRLLAGEFENPGRFSLRTLEFVKALSKDEAHKVHELARWFVDGKVIITPSVIKSFSLVLELEELGIVSGVSGSLRGKYRLAEPKIEGKYSRAIRRQNKALLCLSDEQTMFALKVYSVTKIGQELLSMVQADIDQSYLLEIAEAINKACPRVSEIKIADVVSLNNDNLSLNLKTAKEIYRATPEQC